jgi:hypothetical protein
MVGPSQVVVQLFMTIIPVTVPVRLYGYDVPSVVNVPEALIVQV